MFFARLDREGPKKGGNLSDCLLFFHNSYMVDQAFCLEINFRASVWTLFYTSSYFPFTNRLISTVPSWPTILSVYTPSLKLLKSTAIVLLSLSTCCVTSISPWAL